jgi:hypothetical protein
VSVALVNEAPPSSAAFATIGADSVVGGGVFLTNSVPPGHIVRAPKVELTMRNNPDLPPGSWQI